MPLIAGNVPTNVANYLRAQGGPVPVSLLDLQLIGGQLLYFSDASIAALPGITSYVDESNAEIMGARSEGVRPIGGPTLPPPATGNVSYVAYLPEITEDGVPTFSITDTLVTQTSTVRLQNVSGNTIERDNSLLFSTDDLWGALFVYRLYIPALSYAMFTAIGQVADAVIDEDELELTLESWLNFSKIAAPDCEIGVNCQNVFGSQQCGSSSPTSCLNSYGNCSQINRFKGLITQWNNGVYSIAPNSGLAQPVPPVSYNPRRPS